MAAITLLRAYQHSFDARPNLTLSLTGGTLNAVGDAVAQVTQGVVRAFLSLSSFTTVKLIFGLFFQMQKDKKDQKRPKFDVQRNLRFFCYGMAISVSQFLPSTQTRSC
jgi:protein Mpv17